MESTNFANWILVTGNSSGIGRVATFTLAESGYRVLDATEKLWGLPTITRYS
jgi:NADP-dependent 3-hydroxy acid dehydrogenase YdfG